MSINNIANSVFPNTLSGLDSLNVTNITINGVDVSSLYVPFTNAPSNVDLNNKNLTGVNNVGTTTLIASGLIQGGNITTSGLTTTNTLNISSVSAGTVSTNLAVDSSGNVIQGSSVASQITVNKGAITGVSYYLSMVPTNTSLPQTESLYTEGYVNGYELQYYPNTQTLQTYNLSIQGSTITAPNLPLSTFPSAYIAINASNQIIRTASVSAQPTITQLSASGTYYPIFVNSNSAQSGAAVYVDPSATSPLSYSFTGQVLTAKNLTVTGTTTIVGYAPIASPTFTGIPSAPTAAVGTNTNQLATTAYVTNGFLPITGSIGGVNANYGLSTAFNITNSTFTLTVFSATPTGVALLGTVTAPTKSAGDNSTAVATTAFVTSAVGAYLPLAGGTMTGAIMIDAGNLSFLKMTNSKFVSYTYNITDTGTNGTTTWFQFRTPAALASPAVTALLTIAQPTVFNSYAQATELISSDGTAYLRLVASAGNNYIQSGTAGVGGSYAPLLFTSIGGTVTYATLTNSQFIVSVQGILLNNATNPYLELTSNYVAKATTSGAFMNDSAVGDLVINSRTGNIRLGGGSQYINTALLVTGSGIAIGKNGGGMINSYGKLTLNSNYLSNNGDPQQGFVMDVGDTSATAGIYRCQWFPFVQYGGNVAYQFQSVNANTAYNAFQILSQGTVRMNQNLTFGDDRGTSTSNIGQGLTSNISTTYGSFSALGTKNGWSGMSMYNTRHYVMSNQDNTFGLYDQTYNWLIRGYNGTLIFDSTGYQTYNPGYMVIGSQGNTLQFGQHATVYDYYFNAWTGGVSFGNFYKQSTNSVLWFSGAVSYYVTGAGGVSYYIRLYNTGTGAFYYFSQTNYTNVTYNHVSYPIVAVDFGTIPAGTYSVYMYAYAGNYTSDGNDFVKLIIRITP